MAKRKAYPKIVVYRWEPCCWTVQICGTSRTEIEVGGVFSRKDTFRVARRWSRATGWPIEVEEVEG